MAQIAPITLEALHAVAERCPEHGPNRPVALSLFLANYILYSFLGDGWIEKYTDPKKARDNFLKIVTSDHAELQIGGFRIIDLAEVLFNLQFVDGFECPVGRLRAGDIEGTLAELYFGRLLRINEVPFRYVNPCGVRGSDFDVEITYPDGLVACADAKCKIDATVYNMKSVMNTLIKGRKQLPDDRPGIIFVKTPQHWIDNTEQTLTKELRETARAFLRGTKRIVSVKYYVNVLNFDGRGIAHKHGCLEISNPDNEFNGARNWNLFSRVFPPEWNGVPPFWQRIMFFPTGKAPKG